MQMSVDHLDVLELVDDDATLQAALAFVDDAQLLPDADGDSDLALLVGHEPVSVGFPRDESNSHPAAVLRQTKEKRKRRQSPSVKDELVYLRATVKELEDQLEALLNAPATPDVTEEMWKRVSARQLDQRQRAERENKQLRTLLEEQIRAGKRMERLLLGHNTRPGESVVPAKRLRMLQFTSPLDDPALECQLTDRLLVMHAETNQILAHSRFQDVSLDRVCSVEIQSGQTGPQLHAIETRMVPFDFQTISDAMWDMSMEHEYPRRVILHQDIKADEGIITRVLERSVDLPSGSSRYCGKAVQRWFTDAHRVVVVASMVTDAIQIAGQSFQGACIRTHVWMVLEPVTEANAACGSRKPATIRKLYYLAEPEVYDDDMSEKERRATIDVLSNFVLNSVQAKVDTNYQMLENIFWIASKA